MRFILAALLLVSSSALAAGALSLTATTDSLELETGAVSHRLPMQLRGLNHHDDDAGAQRGQRGHGHHHHTGCCSGCLDAAQGVRVLNRQPLHHGLANRHRQDGRFYHRVPRLPGHHRRA